MVTTSDGIAIQVTELRPGSDQRLLMLHGVGRAGRTFSSLACLFPSRFSVATLDFRGHGNSGHADGRYRICDYLQDALAALSAVGDAVVTATAQLPPGASRAGPPRRA